MSGGLSSLHSPHRESDVMHNILLPFRPRAALQSGGSSRCCSSLDADFQAPWQHRRVCASQASWGLAKAKCKCWKLHVHCWVKHLLVPLLAASISLILKMVKLSILETERWMCQEEAVVMSYIKQFRQWILSEFSNFSIIALDSNPTVSG